MLNVRSGKETMMSSEQGSEVEAVMTPACEDLVELQATTGIGSETFKYELNFIIKGKKSPKSFSEMRRIMT